MSKWCGHCQKTDHNDSECWSTRAIPPQMANQPWYRGFAGGWQGAVVVWPVLTKFKGKTFAERKAERITAAAPSASDNQENEPTK